MSRPASIHGASLSESSTWFPNPASPMIKGPNGWVSTYQLVCKQLTWLNLRQFRSGQN